MAEEAGVAIDAWGVSSARERLVAEDGGVEGRCGRWSALEAGEGSEEGGVSLGAEPCQTRRRVSANAGLRLPVPGRGLADRTQVAECAEGHAEDRGNLRRVGGEGGRRGICQVSSFQRRGRMRSASDDW